MKAKRQVRKLISAGFDIYDFSKQAGVTILCRWTRDVCVFRSVLKDGCVLKGLIII